MFVKKALRRRPGYPVGEPAPVFLECVCGAEVDVRPDYKLHVCPSCRKAFDSMGWLVDPSQTHWYRQIHGTSWVAYDGRAAIWEAVTEGELLAWLHARGIHAQHLPLRIIVADGEGRS